MASCQLGREGIVELRAGAGARAPSSIISRLRIETRDAHASMEDLPAFARLLASDLMISEYRATLTRLHGFHSALDLALARSLANHPAALSFVDGERVRALAEDLAWLGEQSGSPASLHYLPSLPQPESALGCLYVVEGSSLGGRIISRRLRDRLGLDARGGSRFFEGVSADKVRSRWLDLCNMLEDEALNLPPVGGARIVAGAVDTFRCLRRWMAGPDAA